MNDFSLVFVVVGMHLKTAKKQQINSGSHWVFTLWIAHFLNKYGSLQLEQKKTVDVTRACPRVLFRDIAF